MTANDFIVGFKHGVYVIVSDSCEYCQSYKSDIARVNSTYLRIIEVNTDAERKAIYDLCGRTTLPITLAYWKNELKMTNVGHLYGEDWAKYENFLKDFPKSPLTHEELKMLIKDVFRRSKLSYYVFPPSMPKEIRNLALLAGIDKDEMPIDVDEYLPELTDVDKRVHTLLGSMVYAKLVIFNIFQTKSYSETCNKLISEFMKDKYAQTTIEHRSI